MKLSSNTISVLKNYASINQNLVIKEGKEITTMSAMAAAVISSADLVLENSSGTPSLTVKDKKNDTANSYSTGVDTKGEGNFSFFFKVENLKLMDGKYTVEVSSKNISHMKNESTPIEYWIALEPESNYSV